MTCCPFDFLLVFLVLFLPWRALFEEECAACPDFAELFDDLLETVLLDLLELCFVVATQNGTSNNSAQITLTARITMPWLNLKTAPLEWDRIPNRLRLCH